MPHYPTLSELQNDYFTILGSAKPDLNVNDPNSDFVIRGNVLCGFVSGIYADQANVLNDTFIQTARIGALTLIGQSLNITQEPATAATSTGLRVTGTPGTVVSNNLSFLYSPTGVTYTTSAPFTLDASGSATVSITATTSGQITNVIAPATFQLLTVVPGLNNTATLTVNLSNGTDTETVDSFRQRILNRYQQTPSGGNVTDYPQWAFDADPSVRSVSIKRWAAGLGTVSVQITTGTTDINTAVTNGDSINLIPSPSLIQTVQTYYNNVAPLTDCPIVTAPVSTPIDARVSVVLASGFTLSSIPSDSVNNPQGLTVLHLIQREVGRTLYLYAVGGRTLPNSNQGYVFASDIEYGLDVWLSAVKPVGSTSAIGKMAILEDRQVTMVNPDPDYVPLNANQIPVPGQITVNLGD